MTDFLALKRPLAQNTHVEFEDVLKAKTVLHKLGYYAPPDWGITEIPDMAMIDAIKAFQKDRGLYVDGVMKPGGETEQAIQLVQAKAMSQEPIRRAAENVRRLGRYGDTVLAHLSPAEANFLHNITDGGSVNPNTGLLEFWIDDGWDRDEDGNAYDNDAQHGDTDASAAEQADAQARENEAQHNAFGGRDDDDGGNDRPAQQPTSQRTPTPTVATQPANLSTSSGPSRRLGFRGERKRSLLNAKATRPGSGDPYGRFDKSTNPVNNPTSPITEDDIVEQGRKEENAYIREQLKQHKNSTPNANGIPDDNDAQHTTGGWSAMSAQIVENNKQHNAFNSAKQHDPAGYGDMTPVDAVNTSYFQNEEQLTEQNHHKAYYARSTKISKLKGRKNDGLIASGKGNNSGIQWNQKPDDQVMLNAGGLFDTQVFRVNGPVRIEPVSNTVGYQGAVMSVDWYSLDKNGNPIPEYRDPDVKHDTYNVGGGNLFGTPEGPGFLDFSPPYPDANPYGYEIHIVTPPQPVVHGNPSGVDVRVYTRQGDSPAVKIR